MSFAAAQTHVPAHPDRTAYKHGTGMNFDVTFQVWPSRAAMLKTIELQGRSAPRPDHWRPYVMRNAATPAQYVAWVTSGRHNLALYQGRDYRAALRRLATARRQTRGRGLYTAFGITAYDAAGHEVGTQTFTRRSRLRTARRV